MVTRIMLSFTYYVANTIDLNRYNIIERNVLLIG